MSKRAFIFFSLSLLFCTCKKAEPALFQLLPCSKTGIDFKNNLAESDSLNILNYLYYYNGGGVGIADFDNDGLQDIFFSGNETSCRLYLNKGNLKFEDATEKAGLTTKNWCTGVAIADVNGDGWQDIYVCAAGYPQPERRKNMLFINQGKTGKLAFTEKATAYGIADTAHSTQAAFFDYDHDGDLDLYVMNHANERETVNTPLPKKTIGEAASNDHFYKNNGNQTFSDATREAGILTEGYGLGLAISDVNGDGWEDIYVSNDFIYNDLLYINNAGKGFSNQISKYLKHQSYNGMGCDFADFNNDAHTDLVTVDMLPETDFGQKMMAGAMTWDKFQLIKNAGYEPQFMRNSLQLATKSPTVKFSEIAQLAGIAATDWSWAPLFADFDNDGWKDLFITNGYLRDITDKDFLEYSNAISMFKSKAEADRDLMLKIRQLNGKKLPNRIFKNNGDLTFSQKSEAWGMPQPSFSNGAAYADFDNDGDLDLVVNNINEAAFLFENLADKSLKNNHLNIDLKGNPENPIGIGAAVSIVAGGQKQFLEQQTTRGFMSSVSGVLHFGLGKISKIDSLEIRWPDGNRQTLTDIAANQKLTLKQADAKPFFQKENPEPTALMRDASGENGIDFLHKELIFNDFQFQPILPHGFSENGPPIATGDLDGDGLEDFYVGGGKNQPGHVFLQKENDRFLGKNLTEGSKAEDTAALIFDANNDGKNDLFVTSGGSEWGAESEFYQSRLYLNDGKSGLKWAKTALPEMRSPAKCAAAADFDGDGDLDLFVGGSAEMGNYPLSARSYLLRNQGGKFSDATTEAAPFLAKPGIVNAAKWADLDKNGAPDLVLAGEWMPVSVFKNERGKLRDATAEMGLSETSGWWNSLEINDLDHDGDLDLVAGNVGLNTRFRAPLSIYAKDFDKNGSEDAITCRFLEGKEKPIHQRDELLKQINGLGKKYPRYAPFAAASVQDIFGKEALADAYFRKAEKLESACFFNQNGHFSNKNLPLLAQISTVNATACADFDGDSNVDILLTGNSASQNISTGQCDAMNGLLLLGDGAGNFQPLDAKRSGFFMDGVGESLAFLTLKSGKKRLLAGVNGGPLRVFEVQTPSSFSNKNDSVAIKFDHHKIQ